MLFYHFNKVGDWDSKRKFGNLVRFCHNFSVSGPRTAQNTAAILSSMSIRESVQKLKAFLTNLLSISNKQVFIFFYSVEGLDP